jgi:hypothetical protein
VGVENKSLEDDRAYEAASHVNRGAVWRTADPLAPVTKIFI